MRFTAGYFFLLLMITMEIFVDSGSESSRTHGGYWTLCCTQNSWTLSFLGTAVEMDERRVMNAINIIKCRREKSQLYLAPFMSGGALSLSRMPAEAPPCFSCPLKALMRESSTSVSPACCWRCSAILSLPMSWMSSFNALSLSFFAFTN
jgi:hypothetical protein